MCQVTEKAPQTAATVQSAETKSQDHDTTIASGRKEGNSSARGFWGILQSYCHRELGIGCLSFQELDRIRENTPDECSPITRHPVDGLAIRSQDNSRFCFYNSGRSQLAQNYILAHEIGHHLLGHLEAGVSLSSDQTEIEANAFAGVLMALFLYREVEKEAAEHPLQ